jgi:hypothetical protein
MRPGAVCAASGDDAAARTATAGVPFRVIGVPFRRASGARSGIIGRIRFILLYSYK